MGSLGGIIIGLMMLLVVAEVLSRFFLGTSIEGTIETVGIFLALAVFIGFSPCEESDSHVRVNILVRLLPSNAAYVLNIFVYLIAIGIVSITTWQVGLDAYTSLKFREVLPGANIRVPVYPAKVVAFLGYLAFSLQLFVNLIGHIKADKSDVSTL